jgi:methyl-accepting chemotaxis protein
LDRFQSATDRLSFELTEIFDETAKLEQNLQDIWASAEEATGASEDVGSQIDSLRADILEFDGNFNYMFRNLKDIEGKK